MIIKNGTLSIFSVIFSQTLNEGKKFYKARGEGSVGLHAKSEAIDNAIREFEKASKLPETALEAGVYLLRSYYYKNILAFGDLLHRIHPLAGQGFNMTIRDIKILNDIIKKRIDLGLNLDSSINVEFENLNIENAQKMIFEWWLELEKIKIGKIKPGRINDTAQIKKW